MVPKCLLIFNLSEERTVLKVVLSSIIGDDLKGGNLSAILL